MVKANQAYDA